MDKDTQYDFMQLTMTLREKMSEFVAIAITVENFSNVSIALKQQVSNSAYNASRLVEAYKTKIYYLEEDVNLEPLEEEIIKLEALLIELKSAMEL